jgi:DNA polymerase-4
MAQPDTTVEVGTDTVAVHARETDGDERQDLFDRITAVMAGSPTTRPRPAAASRSSCWSAATAEPAVVESRWVLHVDLDEFLAAVEVARHPELRGRPVVVGGAGDPTQRAVVATASYEARRFGVHSGMPLRTAARLCPDAVFLASDPPAYDAVSEVVMAALATLPVVVEVLGWDEAFLGTLSDEPEALAAEVQQVVRDASGLACSVGIGDNRLRAKIATGFAKPEGIYRLTKHNWVEVMGDRPPDALWAWARRRPPS